MDIGRVGMDTEGERVGIRRKVGMDIEGEREWIQSNGGNSWSTRFRWQR